MGVIKLTEEQMSLVIDIVFVQFKTFFTQENLLYLKLMIVLR